MKAKTLALSLILCLFSALAHATPPTTNSSSSTPTSHAPVGSSLAIIQWAGDLAGSTNLTQTVTKLRGVALPAPSGTGALYYNGSALSWNTSLVPTTWANDLAGSTYANQYVAAISGSAGGGGDVPFTSTGLKATSSPFNVKDSGAVTRFSIETAHGRITAGGGGTDRSVVLGPLPTLETAWSSVHLLPNATAASSTNWSMRSDGTSTLEFNVPTSGTYQWWVNGSVFGTLYNPSGSIGSLVLGNVVGSASNYAIQSDGISYTAVNAPGASALIEFAINNSGVPLALAGGTQNGVALGANMATVGHMRTPAGFQWLGRNAANSANITVFGDDGANNYQFANGSASTTISGANYVVVQSGSGYIELAGTDVYADANTQHIRNTAHSEYITVTPAAASLIQFNATNATSGQIGWTGNAAAAGGATSILGEGAGGTNDGGSIVLQGGSHAGSSTVDGSVKINTAFNGGFASVAAASPTNLTNVQSNANFLLLTGAIGGPFTVNYLRRIADTSCAWIKNGTGVTATIAYLTGGTVTVNTATSALVCSDGANLQKVMTGT